MALIPPAILAALVGAGIGSAIKNTNKPLNKKLLPLLLESSDMVKKQKQAQAKGRATFMGGSSQGVRKTRQPRRLATTAITAPIGRAGISRNIAFNGLTLSHSEPFGSISLLAGGTLNSFGTPMVPWNFPFLGGIAANFSKYTWLKLRVYYVPSCPTTTLGECAMGTFFDQQDVTTANFVQIAALKGGISFPPWGGGNEYGKDAVCIEYDVQNFDKPRYNYIGVTAWTALSLSDRNNYTPANLAVASQGSTLAAFAGRLWIDYTIKLIDPIPSPLNA